jgi:TetR/AcrR family acrAB operon transcriptional repressor
MARKRKEDAEKTRTRILASALALFARKGYERTTFTDIAARLKMTKGAVYWHFESKEALLIALVDEMLEKFTRQIEAIMPKEEITFLAVADMMVENARLVVDDANGRAFFMLMRTQIRWGAESMHGVRENLLTNQRFGPWHAFIKAVENDKAAGVVRHDVDAVEVANMCIAVWDGMVQGRIDGLLRTDMCPTIRHAFDAVWDYIKVL